jgi:biopolymer transport protein ExbB
MPGWLLQSPLLTNNVDSLANKTLPVAPKEMHLWEVLVSGGPLMIPLAILFVAALFFFFERYIASKEPTRLMKILWALYVTISSMAM